MDAGVWTIGRDRSKNKQSHRVPITDSMRRVLETLKSMNPDSRYLVPHPTKDQPFGNPQMYVERIRQASAIEERYTTHDLRRVAATRMAELGVPEPVIAKVMNHAGTGSVTSRHYIRASFDNEKREALEAWSKKLATIVSGLQVVNAGR